MKLLYHHRTASRDGQEVHIRELIAALRQAGCEVEVVAPGGHDSSEQAMGGSRGLLGSLRTLLPDACMPLAKWAYARLFTKRLIAAGRRFAPDALYERHALDNEVGRAAAARLGIPLLLEVNAPLAREEFETGRIHELEPMLRREMSVVRTADVVLAVTQVLADILCADGVERSRVHVLHNGASASVLEAPRDRSLRDRLAPDDRTVLGFVGFPRPWHGLDRVVRFLARSTELRSRTCEMWIAGEGPAVEPLMALARELGVEKRVRCLGVLGRDQIVPFLDAIDVALQPAATRYASPLKLFEYLARGVAVLAPRQPNIEEIVRDGSSAILCDPNDDADFERSLERLVTDPGVRERIGRGGRARIDEGGFTWESNARRVIAIAREAAARRKS